MKKALFMICCMLFSINLLGQILKPVTWSYAAKKLNDKEAIVFIKAVVDKGWHIYSVNQKDRGPVKTSFLFTSSNQYTLIGKIIEPKPVTKFEPSFGINVNYFERTVIFKQRIKLYQKETTIRGKINFMVCNNEKCLPPEDVEFSVRIK